MSEDVMPDSYARKRRKWTDEQRARYRFFLQHGDRLKLTMQERDCLQKLGDGMARKDAAAEMCISLSTFNFHIENCYRKLDAKNVAAAFREAIRIGECECPCRRLSCKES